MHLFRTMLHKKRNVLNNFDILTFEIDWPVKSNPATSALYYVSQSCPRIFTFEKIFSECCMVCVYSNHITIIQYLLDYGFFSRAGRSHYLQSFKRLILKFTLFVWADKTDLPRGKMSPSLIINLR